MASVDPRGPRTPSLFLQLLLLLHFWLFVSAGELEVMDQEAPHLWCSQGLSDCRVNSGSPVSAVQPEPNGAVEVTQLQLKVMLCCSTRCQLCLRITIALKAADDENLLEVSEESGEHTHEEELVGLGQSAEGSGQNLLPESLALVKVRLSSRGHQEIWKMLQFKISRSGLVHLSEQPTEKLLLTERVADASLVVVQVDTRSTGTHNTRNITVPSLEAVCSMKLEKTVTECDAPRLRAVTDHRRNVVLLQLDDSDDATRDNLKYQMVWDESPGEVLEWPKGKREVVISSDLVAPCLCFKVWLRGNESPRRQVCPFINQTDALERMQHNVSVSVEEVRTSEGGAALRWNVIAPCRLEAELWLCVRQASGRGCEEVTGSRRTLTRNHRHDRGWRATPDGQWKTGEFNASSDPQLCVQIKIHGLESQLEPHCPFSTSRWSLILPLLLGLLLVCLTILGAYFIQGVMKGYVWRWLKEDDVKGAVGGGHVVLLYPADDCQALPGLMSHLGSSLQALGFSVSLDLWSQAELSVLGPVPWLHSRLDRLKRQGGKVVLVLTQASWRRAEEWGAQSWERSTPKYRNRQWEEEEDGGSDHAPSRCGDVFTASLSCILADYLQGRAGERFMLIQFESLPPEPHGGSQPLPELFRGLHVYSLPSQSLGFLTELAGAQQVTTASGRRKRAGGLRVASRTLARGLSGFAAGTAILRLTGMSQSCVGAGGEELGETVPLQPCLITPPSSPESVTKTCEVEWV